MHRKPAQTAVTCRKNESLAASPTTDKIGALAAILPLTMFG